MSVPLPMRATRERVVETRKAAGNLCSRNGLDGFRLAGADVRHRAGRISRIGTLARFDLAYVADLSLRGNRARTRGCRTFDRQYRASAPVGGGHA